MLEDLTWFTPMMVIPFPNIDPIMFEIGPVAIRWYGLAYVAGILLGWRYMLRVVLQPPAKLSEKDVDDMVMWVTLGVILGGRLGYVIFYKPGEYLSDPMEIFAVWNGGMSFHGGLIGVVTALALFARKRGYPMLAVGDAFACTVPLGLLFGRIANFINGELYGRATDVPWAMVFPSARDGIPRHPSQLYEATLEGLILFLVMYWMAFHTSALRRPGLLTGVFLSGYGLARSAVELFRQPDPFLPNYPLGLTMGQMLSLPLLLIGLFLIFRARGLARPAQ